MLRIRSILIILFFALLIQIASSQNLFCNSDGSDTFAIGSTIIICVHVGGIYRVALPVTIDTYSALSITGAYENITNSGTNLNKNIAIQTQNSATATWSNYTLEKGKVVQTFSYVIQLSSGKVTNIISDNNANCNSCSGSCQSTIPASNIAENNCFIDIDKNTLSNNDPKIFISFIGTDSNNNYLLSQSQRISRFTEYSISSVFQQAYKIFRT